MKKDEYPWYIRIIVGTPAIIVLCIFLIFLMWMSSESFGRALCNTGKNFITNKNKQNEN
jgi:drug/metabolite transporter superfamily protein YnfA